MSIESYSLVEHFDYMKNCIPQPFIINSNDVINIKKIDNDYVIETSSASYTLSKSSLKKLVDSLGVKVKLFSSVCDEDDVLDLVLPAANKLFKCFADCFVFYSNKDDVLNIIDLNVNNVKGDEGTKYENGPSPWCKSMSSTDFTCFANFMERFSIDENDLSIQVKAEDLMPNANNVVLNLFKSMKDSPVQPMLIFKSKFSDMNGFTEIHPALYDISTDITIVFPINYGNKDNDISFTDMWNKLMHIYESVDLSDYIFREINELVISEDSPGSLRSFIANILTNSTLNINQPTKDILAECVEMMRNMKPGKKKKFSSSIGSMIGWSFVQKHSGCTECGRIHL